MDFLILSGDTVVAKWKNNNLEIVNENLLPLYLKNTGNVEKWLETRAIDHHRANSRLLKKALRLAERDDVSSVLSVNAVTITDSYWIKPLDSTLTYSDVRFDNDYFSNLALTGSYDSFNKAANSKNSRTPELTNIGSFEKCWKLNNRTWWMYKTATHEELFSELFIYKLGTRLNFNMAEYERGNKVIKTKDFTDNALVNFEPAFAFMGDNEDYIETLEKLKLICPDAIGDYVKMLFLDTICANPDRHTFNFGILRDTGSGEILGLAPNFDNNMALISRGYPKNITGKNDLLIRLFNELMEYDSCLKQYIPILTEDIIIDVIKSIGMKVQTKKIVEFIMNRYNMIESDK
ncbi:MAG: hypothetical protein IJY81_03770 [Lachnospiraceae bacterium]|nr:hypothetical protein [Lachnospiraceae bacterium]